MKNAAPNSTTPYIGKTLHDHSFISAICHMNVHSNSLDDIKALDSVQRRFQILVSLCGISIRNTESNKDIFLKRPSFPLTGFVRHYISVACKSANSQA